MIRATTGRPVASVQKDIDPFVIRPSSARAKLQSHSYTNLLDDANSGAGAVSRTKSVTAVPAVDDSAVNLPPKPPLEHRLTLGTVHGIGEFAKILTRLNTPASSMKKIKIEEKITLDQLHRIKSAFEEADTDGSGTLDIDEFKMVIKECLGIRGKNEEQIVALFMKIDSSSDGEIDWDEFCTYMQLEYAEKEEAILRAKRIDFVLPALSSTTPHHKAPILRVICVADSSYMCAGQDGLFTFWSKSLKLKRTESLLDSSVVERQAYTAKPSVWVTDVALIPAHGKILVGTGERELHFYELITFEFYCQVIGLDAVPLRIDVCPTEADRCLIVYGDDQGCVSIMMFNAIGDTLRNWKKVPKVCGIPTVTMHDVANGVGTSFVKWKVHEDWVTEIRYFHELRSVISASNHASTALVRGCTTASTILNNLHPTTISGNFMAQSQTPAQGNKTRKHGSMAAQRRQKTDQSVFYVYKGVKTFDFCTATNIVATGGMDRIVRLWNPYVPQKATGLLRGHSSPVVFISIDGEDGRIFSISADKCLKCWDLVEQNCLVTINPKLHKINGEIVACSYSHQFQALAVATDQLSLLKISQKAKLTDEVSVSHNEPVMCCAFNSNFGHVITCSENSVVKLWDFETGTFMFEFNKAHGDTAITSLTFDASGRRLITSGRDGAVRIWNYNNGHCLRSLERENESSEITDCVYVEINKNRFIIAVGWDQRINIFPDQTDYFHHIQRPMPHWPDDLRRGHTEDIVSVTFGKPNLIATASYDGFIIVWNIISGHSVSRIPYPKEIVKSESNSDEEDEVEEQSDIGTDVRAGKQVINKLIFLSNRLHTKDNAALVAGCSDGYVIFWNFHTRTAHARFSISNRNGGLSFMVASSDGNQLYIGDHLGFVYAFDIDYFATDPLLDMDKDIVCPKSTPPPPRLAAWRSHVHPVTWIELIESHDIVLTSSTDYSVRVWTTSGQYIGTFGQSNPWDVNDPTTWQHPRVPPEVLLDPESMPKHPVFDAQFPVENSDESDDEIGELNGDVSAMEPEKDGTKKKKPPPAVRSSQSSRKSSGSWSMSGDKWRRRLSRRLSRSALITGLDFHDKEELTMLDEVRQSMCKSAGKRLRHEKLVARQRMLQTSSDAGAHAFQSLRYFELGEPPDDVTKPNPRDHIDDVFLIQEEEESDLDA
ncbi:cilia- and flagella-associated protein 337-like isoform X2 [Clavelina lepadiformis]|uniref:cilia- and flagella-associated protein 337-like isoform X2 n=1 Tax=Clavelina lepadiformis TaxID=159417 RepID=UPI0040415C4E